MTEPTRDAVVLEIPIFPLSTVLFPGGRLGLRIFEPRYVEMTKACLRDDTVFGVCLIAGGFEVGQPAVPAGIGCTARILEWDVPNPGLFTLVTQGETRFRLLERRTREDGLILGRVALIEPPDPLPVPDRFEPMQRLLGTLMQEIGAQHFPSPTRLDDLMWLASRLIEILPIPPERKLPLLGQDDPVALLAEVETLIQGLRDRDADDDDHEDGGDSDDDGDSDSPGGASR